MSVTSVQRGSILISSLMIQWGKRSKPDVLAVSRSMESCRWSVINKRVSSAAGKSQVLYRDNASTAYNSPQAQSARMREPHLARLSIILRRRNARLAVEQTFRIVWSAPTLKLALSAMGLSSSLSMVSALAKGARTHYMMPKATLVGVRTTITWRPPGASLAKRPFPSAAHARPPRVRLLSC